MAILFVLMLFGNSDPDKAGAAQARRDGYGWGNRITTLPPLVTLEPGGPAQPTDASGDGEAYVYPHGPTVNPEVRKRNQQSARVVVFLFGTLMLLQMCGFCVVVALRRRAVQRARSNDMFTVALEREQAGWGGNSDDENDVDSHPAIASLRSALHPGTAGNSASAAAAGTEMVGLPTYDESQRDPLGHGLPTYAVQNPLPPAAEQANLVSTLPLDGGGSDSDDSDVEYLGAPMAEMPVVLAASAPAREGEIIGYLNEQHARIDAGAESTGGSVRAAAMAMIEDEEDEDGGDEVPLISGQRDSQA